MSATWCPALTDYGHFTTMLVTHGRVVGLELHLDRLVADCATVFGATLPRTEVRERVRAAVAGADGPVVVRVTVVDPDLPVARPSAPARPRVLVTTRPAAPPAPPLRVRSTRYRRDLPAVKHTGLFGALHERRRAQLAGYDDAVFTDAGGLISEGVTWNAGFADADGTVVWPAADALPGVTARLLAAAHDGPQRTEPVPLSRLPAMAAAFATSATTGVRAVAAVDGTRFDTGHPVLDLLRQRYAAVAPETI